MSGLRFCFLTTFYPPHNFGGDGIGIRRLAHGLARRGHRVTIVYDVDAYEALSRGKSPPSSEEEPDGVDVVGVKSGIGLLSPILTQQFGRPVVNGPLIRRILAEGRFDVINFHNVSLIGGPGLFKYGSGVKLYMAHEHWLVCPAHVLWRHGREVCTGRQCLRCQLSYGRPPQWWRWTGLLERELKHIDTFIAMSEFSRQKHREFGFPREMEVLPYFLPTPPSAIAHAPVSPHHRPYFLFVGRLEKIKGLDDVLPVFRDYPDADLLIAGDGDYGPELRRQAAGIERVRFLGRVGLDELRRYYEHAVALIVPSVCFETFGIILIEAMRQGTPVIARRIGPFPEIVAQSAGGLLFWSPSELVQAMSRIQTEPGLRDRLAEAGRSAVEAHWSEAVVVAAYLDIVRRAAVVRGAQSVVAQLASESLAPESSTVSA